MWHAELSPEDSAGHPFQRRKRLCRRMCPSIRRCGKGRRVDLTVDYTVILNDASQSEGCTGADPFDADCLNLTPQAEALVVGSMCRHDNVALDPLPQIDRMSQQAIEAMLVDVFSTRPDWLPEARKFQIYSPMKLQPGASPPFGESHTGSIDRNRGPMLKCWDAHRPRTPDPMSHVLCHERIRNVTYARWSLRFQDVGRKKGTGNGLCLSRLSHFLNAVCPRTTCIQDTGGRYESFMYY
jgi:hypothetical protein